MVPTGISVVDCPPRIAPLTRNIDAVLEDVTVDSPPIDAVLNGIFVAQPLRMNTAKIDINFLMDNMVIDWWRFSNVCV